MRYILQKMNNGKNQTFKSGFSAIYNSKFNKISMLAFALSLFLVGSCNESAGFFDFSRKPEHLNNLSKADLVRYGYALQVAMLQQPENIEKLQADEIKLALSKPDMERKDGANNIWQYRTKDCVLDIYWNKANSSNPVSYVEFRQRRSILDATQPVADPVEWQCLQTIIQDRRRAIRRGFNDI